MKSGSVLLVVALFLFLGAIAFFVLLGDDGERRPVADAPSAVQQPLPSDSGEETAPEQAGPADEGQAQEAEVDSEAAQDEAAETASSEPQAPEDQSQAEERAAGETVQPEGADQAEATATAPARETAERESGTAEPAESEEQTAAGATAERQPAQEQQPAQQEGADDDGAGTVSDDQEPPGTAVSQEEAVRRTEESTASTQEDQLAALPTPEEEQEAEEVRERERALPETSKPEPPPTGLSFDVVRIDRDGSLVAAGRSPPGSRVFLLRDGRIEAEAEADAQGNWVLILDQPLPSGDYELSLEAELPSGERVRSSELVVASIPGPRGEEPTAAGPGAGQEEPAEDEASDRPVAIAVPEQGGGARVLQGRLNEQPDGLRTRGLAILSVDYDAAGFIRVAGRGLPDATILAYLDNRAIGRTRVAADEGWLIAPQEAVEEGLYQLRVDQLNGAGEVIARLETVFARTVFIADLPRDRMVVVQPGNSLWRLARRLYGKGILYSVIYEANQDQIRDPDLIYPGQIFIAPPEN